MRRNSLASTARECEAILQTAICTALESNAASAKGDGVGDGVQVEPVNTSPLTYSCRATTSVSTGSILSLLLNNQSTAAGLVDSRRQL